MDRVDVASATWRRRILGIGGVVALVLGLYLYTDGADTATIDFIRASCVKAGLVLLAAWLALPQLDRVPGWVFTTAVGGMLLLAVRPRIVAMLLRYSTVLVPIFAAIWLLRRLAPRPRGDTSPKRPN